MLAHPFTFLPVCYKNMEIISEQCFTEDLLWSGPLSCQSSSCKSLLQWGCRNTVYSAGIHDGHAIQIWNKYIFGHVQASCVLGNPQHLTGLSQLKILLWFLSEHIWGRARGLRATKCSAGLRLHQRLAACLFITRWETTAVLRLQRSEVICDTSSTYVQFQKCHTASHCASLANAVIQASHPRFWLSEDSTWYETCLLSCKDVLSQLQIVFIHLDAGMYSPVLPIIHHPSGPRAHRGGQKKGWGSQPGAVRLPAARGSALGAALRGRKMRTVKACMCIANFQTYRHQLPCICEYRVPSNPACAALGWGHGLAGAGSFAPSKLIEMLLGVSHVQEIFLQKPAGLFIKLEIYSQFYNVKASALCFHL